ncbi:MAG TPA: DNA repair protein RecN [Pyrinomonadaceae bacterium]|jgi:DNA repair protein RecN (Recombination protein N)|nr:DNA repair protein RecN [Pyrinomonadaceae bacterium]
MLKSLNISDFAVIRRLRIDFGRGLNLLTGETGSGKSIIVDALGLLLGNRASAELIRTGEEVALVEGVFELPEEKEKVILENLAELGVTVEDEELLIRREINSRGRSRVFINDQQVTTATLRALQPALVEIHGQGEQRALLSPQSQMDLLDAFAGCQELRRRVSEAFAERQEAAKALEQLRGELINRERDTELLRFQLTEIESVGPRPGEDLELQGERKLLAHAERVSQLGSGAYAELYEDDGSVLSRLAAVRRQLEELSKIDARAVSTLEVLETGMLSLTEVAEALRRYGDRVEANPLRLAEVEHRLAALERLKSKYKCDLRGVIEIQDELSGRLSGLTNLSAREQHLRDSLERADALYTAAARLLTERRKEAAPGLERRVMADLRHVALEQARFVVLIETAQPGSEREAAGTQAPESGESTAFYTPRGADRVEFLLSANPGESPRSLARIASGGELSRLMLTLRTVCMDTEGAGGLSQSSETVVFDEIDVGIGGRVAEAVGRRLKMLSKARQVLCVTHQPQIARFADHHFVVEKAVRGGRTITTAKELEAGERVGELARMIGGAEEVETTREAARWLLDNSDTAGTRSRRKRGQTKS